MQTFSPGLVQILTANNVNGLAAAIPGGLAIDSLSVPTSPLLLHHKVKIVAHLRADDTRSGPMSVAFYNGAPRAEHNFPRVGANRLKFFIGEVEAQRGVTLTNRQADQRISQRK